MGDNEQNATNQADDQKTNEAEGSDEQRAAALKRRVEKVQESSLSAPVDDDVIIK